MSMVEIIQTYVQYNEAMTRKVWESIMTLSDQQFQQPLSYSHGSIRDLMVHISIIERRWLGGLQEDPHARTYTVDSAGFSTRQQAFDYWEQGAAALQDYIQNASDESLADTPLGMLGPAWQVLLHIVNHGTDHRSQVLRALTDQGAPAFDQDFIIHQWFRK